MTPNAVFVQKYDYHGDGALKTLHALVPDAAYRDEKADYAYRLDAIERAGRAGARRLNIGVLLGLSDWRVDAFHVALHARYLQRACWQSSIAVSFPRLNHVPERFDIPQLVSDAELVQDLLAMRLFLPESPLVLSTRERPELRDRLPGLLAVEMEGAAVAQVCHEYGVPYAVMRTVSDRADYTAHMDFAAFLKEVASHYSNGVLRRLLAARAEADPVRT